MPLRAIILDGDHSLHHQAFAPRELLTGVVCADGFGVGWYDADVQAEPARYARAQPIWSDDALAGVASLVRSRCMVAAVRNATIPGANHESNCAPFASGRHLMSHNGYLDDWQASWRDEVEGWIAPQRRRLVRGTTESEHLFQALLSHLDALDPEPGALANAARSLLLQVRDHASSSGTQAQMNLLVSDGTQVVATRMAARGPPNSLYTCLEHPAWPHASLVASEPLDGSPGWQAVPPDHIIVLQAGAPAVRMRV